MGAKLTKGTAAGGEVGEGNLEGDAGAAWGGGCGDGAFDVAAGVGGVEEFGDGEDRGVDWAYWVVKNDGGVALELDEYQNCCTM